MWRKFRRKHVSSTTAAWPWRAAQCKGSASCLSLPLHHAPMQNGQSKRTGKVRHQGMTEDYWRSESKWNLVRMALQNAAWHWSYIQFHLNLQWLICWFRVAMLEKRDKILELFIGGISIGQRVSKARRTSKSVNLFATMSLLRLSGPWPTRRRTCGTWFWCQSFLSICWHVCLWKLCVFTSVPPTGSRHHIQMPTSCSVVQGCLPRTVRCMDVSTCGYMWERLWGCAAARRNFAGNLTNWCAKSMTHLLYSSFRTWLWSNQVVNWEKRKTKGKKCAQSTSSAQSIPSRPMTGLLPYPIRGYSSNTSYSSLHYYHVQGCINSTMAMFMACSQERGDDFWMSSCGSLHHSHPRIWSLD